MVPAAMICFFGHIAIPSFVLFCFMQLSAQIDISVLTVSYVRSDFKRHSEIHKMQTALVSSKKLNTDEKQYLNQWKWLKPRLFVFNMNNSDLKLTRILARYNLWMLFFLGFKTLFHLLKSRASLLNKNVLLTSRLIILNAHMIRCKIETVFYV